MHSATIKYFKTLELICFQNKVPKRGQPKAKEGQMLHLPERNPAYTYTRSDHAQIQDCNDSNQ